MHLLSHIPPALALSSLGTAPPFLPPWELVMGCQ